MDRFLADFPPGLAEDRYRTDELPHLAFGDGEFDLALCSHFLFLYSDHLTAGFHVAAIREMCRVAGEARVFPLLGAYGAPPPTWNPLSARSASAATRPMFGPCRTSSCGAATRCCRCPAPEAGKTRRRRPRHRFVVAGPSGRGGLTAGQGRLEDPNSVTSASIHSAPWKRATLTRWWPS